jgi:uncharacterized protein
MAARSSGLQTVVLDLPPLVGAFGRRLRDAGLPVTAEHATRFAHALSLTRPLARRRLYWTARAVFVSDRTQVKAFDAVFAEVFGVTPAPAPGAPADGRQVPAPPDQRPTADTPSDPERSVTGEMWAATEELIRGKRFDALEPAELAELYRLMSELELATPRRLTRRAERWPHGAHVDMRRTLRGSLRTGGDPIRLAHRRRRVERRRLVLLCDISGSMEPYARAYLQFLTCAAGAGDGRNEAFVFATRLTRLTRALHSRNPERGEPDLVALQMQRLRRLAYRIVWVNPRVAASEFSPRAGGMAAALPHCDALVSGHSLQALGQVVEAIAADRRRDAAPGTSWRPPEPAAEAETEDPWASATPVPGSSVAMPSGYGPSRGRTTPGWGPG